MRDYKLGEFEPYLARWQHILDLMARIRPPSRALARQIEELMLGGSGHRRAGRHPAPDLLDRLPEDSVDRWWVREVESALTRLRDAGRSPTLLSCRWDPAPGGYVAIAAMDNALTADVRKGDAVVAGFIAIRRGSGVLEVLPRVYRKICRNGQVSLDHSLTNALSAGESVGEAVELCMSRAELEGSLERYRIAAATPVRDPNALLSAADLRSSIPAVADRFANQGEPTGWGLVNAATALARDETDWSRRIDLEQDGARILAVVCALHDSASPAWEREFVAQ